MRTAWSQCLRRARGMRADKIFSPWLGAALVASTLIGGSPAVAQTVTQAAAPGFPSRPVRMIVGFPPGTGPDIVARVISQKLAESWQQSVVVDNKAGAAGIIAAQEAARAAPDGYTIMLGEVGQLSIAPSSYARLPYDPQKDFVPISEAVSADFALVVSPQASATDLKSFIDWARGQKGLNFATFGAGTPGHFGAVAFADAAGLTMEPIHYRTTADALGGLASNSVQGTFVTVGLAAPQVQAGKLRALAITGKSRSAILPDTPTFSEAGLAKLDFTAWFGFVAPAATPATVVDALNTAIVKAVTSADARAKLEAAGFRIKGSSRADFQKLIQDDTQRWGAIVKATGFKASVD